MFYIQKCEYDEHQTHPIEDDTDLTDQLADISTQLSSIHTHNITDGEHVLRLDQLHNVKTRCEHPIPFSSYVATASSQFGTGTTYQASNAFLENPSFKWSSGTYFYEGELYDNTNFKKWDMGRMASSTVEHITYEFKCI